MPRALHPSSPADELTDRRKWTGATLADGLITEELAEFCQTGVSIVLGSQARSGRPLVARGLACRIDTDGTMRIVLREPSNAGLISAVTAGAAIAATFTKPETHRSIQFKASHASLLPITQEDGPATVTQTARLSAELMDVGYTKELALHYCAYEPFELCAIEFMPETAYVQTPGPSAGSALLP